MRFYLKLLAMIAIGVGTQGLIERNEQELDDAQFAARCFFGKLCGRQNNDAALMDAASALHARQMKRMLVSAPATTVAPRATTRPAGVRAASVADELEWSLACAGGACDAPR